MLKSQLLCKFDKFIKLLELRDCIFVTEKNFRMTKVCNDFFKSKQRNKAHIGDRTDGVCIRLYSQWRSQAAGPRPFLPWCMIKGLIFDSESQMFDRNLTSFRSLIISYNFTFLNLLKFIEICVHYTHYERSKYRLIDQ